MLKLKICLLISLLVVFSGAWGNNLVLPEIGTAGIRGLTVQREQQLGDYFMRAARGGLPILQDPVIEEYVSSIGNKLVLYAPNVHFPFEFFVTSNTALNASAFLGGKIMVNTGLLHYCDTEDEFASVLAHEISHVTQRHIARFIEQQSASSSLSLAGIIGSVAAAIINPMVGMAALSTTIGMSMQSALNFTRENEIEADHLGLALLARSGYNPQGMTDMFRKLQRLQGNLNPALAMLTDHPLSSERIVQAENRVRQLKSRPSTKNPSFELCKARIDVRYMRFDLPTFRENLQKAGSDTASQTYRNYALALIAYAEKHYQEADRYLSNLNSLSQNIFVLDLRTDLDLKLGRASQSIATLASLHQKKPQDAAVTLNYANALLESGNPQAAIKVLEKFTRKKPQHLTAWSLLADAYQKAGNRCQLLQARGEIATLRAHYPQAVGSLSEALNTCTDRYTREILKAKITRVNETRNFDESISKGGL